jgi:hypothetical protein
VADRLKLPVYYAVLGLLVVIAALTARNNTLGLIAEPQGYEWEMVHNAVMRTNFKTETKVYLIMPQTGDRTTARMFADEFGSLSAGSDVVAKEIFKAAIRDRFGSKMPKGTAYTLAVGTAEPAGKTYDLVIDLRKLKALRMQ